MNRNEFPRWAKVLLALVAIVVLGPPVLGVLAVVAGITIALAAVVLKYALIAAGIFAMFLVIRALFSGADQKRAAMPSPAPMVDHEAGLKRDDEELRALDAELARVMAAQGKSL
ncbi:MAG: hypothetical protein ACO1OB_30115 [Archangium sp.]